MYAREHPLQNQYPGCTEGDTFLAVFTIYPKFLDAYAECER